MNSIERAALRRTLRERGFRRRNSTHDAGDGSYEEVWTNDDDEDTLVIEWGPRS